MTTRGRFAVSGLGASFLIAAVVAYVLVLLTGDGWLLAIAAISGALPLVDLAWACRAGTVVLTRPSRAVAGQPTPVRCARVGQPAVETDLVATLFGAGGAVRARVHAGCDALVTFLPAGDRGPMPQLRWIADTYGPLGLTARRRHHLDVTPILVHPAAADPLPLLVTAAAAGEGRNTGTDPGSVAAGVRIFRTGDAARSVHWRSTARRGVPVVRADTCELGRSLVVAAGTFTPADEPGLARVAATALQAHAQGIAVTLLSTADRCTPGTAAGILDWFAELRPGATPQVPPGPVLWVTGRPHPPGGTP